MLVVILRDDNEGIDRDSKENQVQKGKNWANHYDLIAFVRGYDRMYEEIRFGENVDSSGNSKTRKSAIGISDEKRKQSKEVTADGM